MDGQLLEAVAENCPMTTKLNLFEPNSCDWFCKIISGGKNFIHLTSIGINVEALTSDKLETILKRIGEGLLELDISYSHVQSAGLAHIAQYSPHLTLLSIRRMASLED